MREDEAMEGARGHHQHVKLAHALFHLLLHKDDVAHHGAWQLDAKGVVGELAVERDLEQLKHAAACPPWIGHTCMSKIRIMMMLYTATT